MPPLPSSSRGHQGGLSSGGGCFLLASRSSDASLPTVFATTHNCRIEAGEAITRTLRRCDGEDSNEEGDAEAFGEVRRTGRGGRGGRGEGGL
eukprot:9473668-Pyramimonas_sp.AAC.1